MLCWCFVLVVCQCSWSDNTHLFCHLCFCCFWAIPCMTCLVFVDDNECDYQIMYAESIGVFRTRWCMLVVDGVDPVWSSSMLFDPCWSLHHDRSRQPTPSTVHTIVQNDQHNQLQWMPSCLTLRESVLMMEWPLNMTIWVFLTSGRWIESPCITTMLFCCVFDVQTSSTCCIGMPDTHRSRWKSLLMNLNMPSSTFPIISVLLPPHPPHITKSIEPTTTIDSTTSSSLRRFWKWSSPPESDEDWWSWWLHTKWSFTIIHILSTHTMSYLHQYQQSPTSVFV